MFDVGSQALFPAAALQPPLGRACASPHRALHPTSGLRSHAKSHACPCDVCDLAWLDALALAPSRSARPRVSLAISPSAVPVAGARLRPPSRNVKAYAGDLAARPWMHGRRVEHGTMAVERRALFASIVSRARTCGQAYGAGGEHPQQGCFTLKEVSFQGIAASANRGDRDATLLSTAPAEAGKTPPSRQTEWCVMAAEKAALFPPALTTTACVVFSIIVVHTRSSRFTYPIHRHHPRETQLSSCR